MYSPTEELLANIEACSREKLARFVDRIEAIQAVTTGYSGMVETINNQLDKALEELYNVSTD